MAQGDIVRKPTAVTEEVDLSQMRVKLLVEGIIPPTFGNKKKPKNGDADVTFMKWGFHATATVRKTDGQETKWVYAVKKLPSEIVINRSSWKVDKGMIVITLHKKEEISWVAMLRRGLEQADSSEGSGSDEEKSSSPRALQSTDIADTEMVTLKEPGKSS